MSKATQTLSFLDDDQTVKTLKVIVNDDYSVSTSWLNKEGQELTANPEAEPKKESLGSKVEGIIDGLTGGKLKKCGGCARRKAMLDKLGALNEQVTETTRNVD